MNILEYLEKLVSMVKYYTGVAVSQSARGVWGSAEENEEGIRDLRSI